MFWSWSLWVKDKGISRLKIKIFEYGVIWSLTGLSRSGSVEQHWMKKLLLLKAHHIFSLGLNSLGSNSIRNQSNGDFDYLMMTKLTVDSGTFEVYQWKGLSQHEKWKKWNTVWHGNKQPAAKVRRDCPFYRGTYASVREGILNPLKIFVLNLQGTWD